jgi:hypothetical protein
MVAINRATIAKITRRGVVASWNFRESNGGVKE